MSSVARLKDYQHCVYVIATQYAADEPRLYAMQRYQDEEVHQPYIFIAFVNLRLYHKIGPKKKPDSGGRVRLKQ